MIEKFHANNNTANARYSHHSAIAMPQHKAIIQCKKQHWNIQMMHFTLCNIYDTKFDVSNIIIHQ